jgi:antitoxin component of MazEF toxin-antitoxin module
VDSGRIVAILHSIVQKENQKMIDITPFDDNRTYNLFAVLKNQTPDYSRQEIWWPHK